ncbi:Axoneme-associated protein mst101 [Entamoeba marina]
MRALLVILIAVYALAEDDLFSRYAHENRKNEKSLLALEDRERKILNTINILYGDMKIAVDQDDRIKVEMQVENLQKTLIKIRKQKKIFASPYRDRLVRSTRIEHRLGYEENNHIHKEIIRNQEALTKQIAKIAHKYATMAAQIASQKLANKINKKSGKGSVDILKSKSKFKKVSKHAYTKYYKKIVNAIEKAAADGVEKRDIKMVCRTASDHIIRKLLHQYLTIVKAAEKKSKVTKKHITSPMRKSMKTLGKAFDKKMIKKTAEAKTHKVSEKKVKKALKKK